MPQLPDTALPRYQRLYLDMRDAILSGRLPAGSRLPGSRSMALQLGVSRIVVLMAYEQLANEGYISSQVGSGSRVAVQASRPAKDAGQPEKKPLSAGRLSAYAVRTNKLRIRGHFPHRPAPEGIIDFRFVNGIPDARTLMLWRQAVTRAAASPRIDYPSDLGNERLRRALAASLSEQRGVFADADDIIIVNGSQQGLDLITRALCDPGDRVGIEDPHYLGMRHSLLAAGLRVVPCPVDQHGFDLESNVKKLRGVRAVWLTPSRQFPTGAVMSIERRLKLLDWAARNDVWIIEDDYDCEFLYGVGQVPALQGLDRAGKVIYLGTFARTLFSGLRLGYLAVPPALRETFRGVKWLADHGTSLLEQRAMVDFIHSGGYEASRRRGARRLIERNLFLRAELRKHFVDEELSLWGTPFGMHQYLQATDIPAEQEVPFVDHALSRGVRVVPGSLYHASKPANAAFMLGYSRLEEPGIRKGVERFARAVHSFPGRRRPRRRS